MSRLNSKGVLIFLVSILIGLLLVAQIRYSSGGKMYVAASSIAEYEALIQSEKAATEAVKAQIAETEKLLDDYRLSAKKEDNLVIKEKLKSELTDYQLLTGNEAARGPGVIITVDDGDRELIVGEDINNLLVHDADILLIINELKKCKAEAISVNGHRITPYTSIVCSGYTVRMDGVTYARPFEIKAIGDSKRISSVLLSSEGVGTVLKEYGVKFSIEYAEELKIDAAESTAKFKYAGPAEKEEGQKQEM